MPSQQYVNSGEFSFTVPAGVTSLTAEATGGGGGGGSSGHGGGGGEFARTVFTVAPGQVIDVHVGYGGLSDTDGDYSWAKDAGTCLANGGWGGNNFGDAGQGGVGDITLNGGSGAGHSADETGGGGGGGSGELSGAGQDGDLGGDGGQGGDGGSGGGQGGSGGSEPGVTPGQDGLPPGGGGGGTPANLGTDGGIGADGQVVLSWTVSMRRAPMDIGIGIDTHI